MIAPIYKRDGMYYANTSQIVLYGFNINLQRRIFNNCDINSVYSYTNGISDDKQLVEGISKHAFNMRIKYNILNRFNILFTTKYNSSKNIFVYDSGDSRSLDSYSISDILVSFKYKSILIKTGCKNVFNYLDPGRLDSASKEFLTTTDPGRRFYFNISFSI